MSTFNSAIAAVASRCVDLLGSACSHIPALQAAYDITLILEKPIEGDPDYPAIYYRASGLTSAFTTAPAKGDRVTVGDETYYVFAVRADEGGMTALLLNRS